MCGEFKDLSQSLTYMEEHGASRFWTNNHRESEAFSCWKYHGEEGECLQTATASVVKGSLKFPLCFFVHNSICMPHFHLHSSCNLHNEHLQSLRSGFTLYHIYCSWPSALSSEKFPRQFSQRVRMWNLRSSGKEERGTKEDFWDMSFKDMFFASTAEQKYLNLKRREFWL